RTVQAVAFPTRRLKKMISPENRVEVPVQQDLDRGVGTANGVNTTAQRKPDATSVFLHFLRVRKGKLSHVRCQALKLALQEISHPVHPLDIVAPGILIRPDCYTGNDFLLTIPERS